MKLKLTDKSISMLKDDTEFVAKWIEGLRSGKYTQNRGKMFDLDVPNSACCLMVMEMECNGREWGEVNKYHEVPLLPSNYNNGIRWVEKLVAYDEDSCRTFFPSDWNDELGMTFDQIADLLEYGEVEIWHK